MLAKLAARNVRRSARDYAIYFVTVALGVALFYAFNTIYDQAVMLDALSADSKRMLGLLNTMTKLLSLVIVCVLGFLVVYANRFLIRRRRREFGTYLMLGMSAGRVSRVLLFETAYVGLASLLAGLAVGIGLSQGMSFATAALMGATMSKYQFVVSGSSLLFTTACFLGIFLLSALIDIVYIRRCKLASLLSPQQHNEGRVQVNVPVRVGAFVVAIAVLTCAYWQLHVSGMLDLDEHFAAATVLMVVGTFLFFWSVAGFATTVLQRARGVYFRGLTTFTTRQISSKINTAFASMSVVSILLFFALTICATGMGLVELFVGNLEQVTQYDNNVRCYPAMLGPGRAGDGPEAELYAQYDGDMAACLADLGEGWDSFVKATAQVDYYTAEDLTYEPLLAQIPNAESLVGEDLLTSIGRTSVQVYGVSQYNVLCALTGRVGLTLAADECAVNNLMSSVDALARALCDNQVVMSVAGFDLRFSAAVATPVRNGTVADVALEIIVPDAVIEALKAEGDLPNASILDIMYSVDRATGDAAFNRYLHAAYPVPVGEFYDETLPEDQQFVYTYWPCFAKYSGREMADQASGLRMVITYLAVYIGFILLVATAAILAIQQLSETADSLGRYRRLRDLGADQRAILGSLRTQTVVYFLAPLVLAAAHTACAVSVLSNALFLELGVNLFGSIMAAAGVVALIYGIYLVVTYLLSRSIVRVQ